MDRYLVCFNTQTPVAQTGQHRILVEEHKVFIEVTHDFLADGCTDIMEHNFITRIDTAECVHILSESLWVADDDVSILHIEEDCSHMWDGREPVHVDDFIEDFLKFRDKVGTMEPWTQEDYEDYLLDENPEAEMKRRREEWHATRR